MPVVVGKGQYALQVSHSWDPACLKQKGGIPAEVKMEPPKDWRAREA